MIYLEMIKLAWESENLASKSVYSLKNISGPKTFFLLASNLQIGLIVLVEDLDQF
jgi:hypothetical protein